MSLQAADVIRKKKQELGDRLIILGHHYQSDDIIAFADFVGDSLELARKASQVDTAEYIVFCGVYFMAESAAILAPLKKVFIPDMSAGCPLADMADPEDVERAWKALSAVANSLMPVSYVNSSAVIKAFCGRNGGIICTSGNAHKVLEWALGRADKVFFLPDMNLGRNTAVQMGIPDGEIVLWDHEKPDGGLTAEDIKRARIILWKGWCPVHWPGFTAEDVKSVREKYPGIRVMVHPESDPKTVAASDASGSTASILKKVREMSPGESLAIGTETNMVRRAAEERKSIQIVPLREVFCEDMARITLDRLADTLIHLEEGTYQVTVAADIARDAYTALTNMLRI